MSRMNNVHAAQLDQRTVELTKAVKLLADSLDSNRYMNFREFQLMLFTAGCILFGAGAVVGYHLGHK